MSRKSYDLQTQRWFLIVPYQVKRCVQKVISAHKGSIKSTFSLPSPRMQNLFKFKEIRSSHSYNLYFNIISVVKEKVN